jgi:hypothetical protein
VIIWMVIVVLLWMCLGAMASCKLYYCSNCKYSVSQLTLHVLLGCLWFLDVESERLGDSRKMEAHTFSDSEWTQLRLTRADNHNPFSEELKDALIHLRDLHGRPGEVAQRERERLSRLVVEMRGEPARLRLEPVEGYVVSRKLDYDNLEAYIKKKMELYEKARAEVLVELSGELPDAEDS